MARKILFDREAFYKERNKTLTKSAKTDKALITYRHKKSPLTGRYAVIDGKTYREARHPEHGVYWTVKNIPGLDAPAGHTPAAPAAPAATTTVAAVKLELLRMQLQILSEMKALAA